MLAMGAWDRAIPLFDQLLGTIDYEMTYTDGELEGGFCIETYQLTTVDASDEEEELEALMEDCPDCDTLWLGTFELVDEEACVGGPELNDTNYIALDLISEPGSAIFWWGDSSGANWWELESGEIDFDEVVIEVEDQGGGSTSEDPCSWWDRCSWDAVYVNYFDLGSTDRPDDE